MKTPLAIVGQGTVTPGGVGVEALDRAPVAENIAEVRRPSATWPVFRVDLKDSALVRWQREPRLRRASPISYFLVEAASQALTGLSAGERAETGLIVAFSAGCLAYSRRFYEGIVKQGQRAASPALFPETVFNSPVSHVVSVLGLNGAAYALVGDESAWVAALKTAAVWLRLKRVHQVLVLGAEEFDPVVLDAYRSSGWLRKGFVPSEGAAGVLVREATPDDSFVITQAHDGYIYRTRTEAADAAHRLIEKSEPSLAIYPTASTTWVSAIEPAAIAGRLTINEPRPYLGTAFTASAAWHTLRASRHLTSAGKLFLPVWGLNHQFGSLELERRK